jgi:sulfate adenylyltransferase
MTVTDKWTPNKAREAEKVFGADDSAHPAVNYLHNTGGPGLSRRPDHRHPAAGALRFPRPPRHAQRAARLFPQARLAPVVAFQTRNPLHRAHQELTFRAAKEARRTC